MGHVSGRRAVTYLVIETRPPGVPESASYVPPGSDFSVLRALHEGRVDKRSLLRVSFVFVAFRVSGPLRDVMYRAVTVRPTRYGQYMVLCFSDETQPVPGMWVWSVGGGMCPGGT